MRLEGLNNPLKNFEAFNNIINYLNEKKYPLGVYGLSESSKSYMINGIFDSYNKSIFVFSYSEIEAKNIYEDLSLYTTSVYYLPTRDVVFYNIDAISGDLRWERLKVIREMLKNNKKIIVTSINNLASSYVPLELYKKYIFNFKVGDTIDLQDLSTNLIKCGYEKVDVVDSKGQFSLRGGILDIFNPINPLPFRIELFDDEIDSIRTFNLESQRSIDKVQSIEIFAAKEMILEEENINRGYDGIKVDAEAIIQSLKKIGNRDEVQKIKSLIYSNLEMLKNTWSFETIDSFMPYFYKKTSNFFDFLGDSFVLIDDTQRCMGKLNSTYFEFEENFKSLLQNGSVLKRQGELLIQKEFISDFLEKKEVITFNSIQKTTNELKPKSIVTLNQISAQNYHGQLDILIDDIKNKKRLGYRTLILCGTRPRGERLVNTLKDRDIETVYRDVVHEIKPGEVVITFGTLQKGFEFPDIRVCVISDKEVFGQSKVKTSKSKTKGKGIGKIKSFTELKIDDYVVHTSYGIGIYKGIKQLNVEEHKKDFLVLKYSGEDVLYVPVEQLDLIQKYIGSEGNAPKLNKLGGVEWIKTKNKVKKSIDEIAEGLVKLYAVRNTVKGFTYSKDTVWQKQFEEEFPYEETPDQISAIEEIKKDMESDKPMDRLLCGDVGYGKTEVAVRAAFKAVMDSKQVAFLVPTTILAEQHYNNFIHRFSDFPVKVGMVSRFKSSTEIKNTIKEVNSGEVDILIGTHRLLQKDVKFKDLGVLIIDEEQRFGVTHKEKIKNLKKNIDVLTLSATPIPRTLNMSLIGVRDISVIETPPEERYPIQTYVVEYNEQLIRDAILREIGRGGQCFFVYNRVETIKDMASQLSKLVPEANVAIAHGQMTERELENVMIDFMQNKYNILVCTTIIETGIDIPNVNTLVIYDADKMGLSQLYQLRGRVGRSNRIAYSYFTYRKDKVLTEVAEKRLKAIKDFTELGSGFKIALRDLEIRGAGNMMGEAQHGHMAAVGYDLYCRMLEDAIKNLKGDINEEPCETSLEIKVDAYIPNEYIGDETLKIEAYKKIAAINSLEEMMDIEEELEDRYSNIPTSVYNLIKIAYLRSLSKKIGIVNIKEKNDEIVFEFLNRDKLNSEVIDTVMKKLKNRLHFIIGEKPAFGISVRDIKREEIIDYIKEFVEYVYNVVLK